jgi:hypothetical protein
LENKSAISNKKNYFRAIRACPHFFFKKRYGRHFDVVRTDLKETDDLRILDYEGCRAFRMFSFKELGQPMMYEKEKEETLSSL